MSSGAARRELRGLNLWFGSLTIQSEWGCQFFSDARDASGGDQGTVMFHGGYAQVMYFLTGEHENYEKQEGVFGRVVPFNSVSPGRGGGSGAWQVAWRLSLLDLTDKGIIGGRLVDMTCGVSY